MDIIELNNEFIKSDNNLKDNKKIVNFDKAFFYIKDDKFIKIYNKNSIGVIGEKTILNIKHPNLMEFYFIKELEYDIEFYYKYYSKEDNWIDLIDIYNNYSPKTELIEELYNNKRQISLDIINVVRYLHDECNIAHRDIKPDNILYNSKEQKIILCDYEYCRIINKLKKNRKFILGTPLYFPPEMKNNKVNFIDYEKVDIWNIGFVMYIIFFNKMPIPTKIYNDSDVNLLVKDIKDIFFYTLNLYPEERKSLDEILKLDYFK